MYKAVVRDDMVNYINIIRGLAIFSIICAHVSSISPLSLEINNYISITMSSIGTIGVGVFFFVTGLLFNHKQEKFSAFIQRKSVRIIIPWIIIGTAVYIYANIGINRETKISFLEFIIGNGSYLYFLTILITHYIILFFIDKLKKTIPILMFISIFSLVSVNFGILEMLNPYLNPFNWLVFTLIGYLINYYGVIHHVLGFAVKYTFLLILLVFGFIIVIQTGGTSITYWRPVYILFEMVSILTILGISKKICTTGAKILSRIGEKSFAIYLLHMPVAGIIVHFTILYDSPIILLVRPMLVLLITYYSINVYMRFARLTTFENNLLNVIGIDKNRS